MSGQSTFDEGYSFTLPSSRFLSSALTNVSVSRGHCRPADITKNPFSFARISFHIGKYSQRFSKHQLAFLISAMNKTDRSNVEQLTSCDEMENGNTIKKTVFQRFSDDSVMLAELDKSKVFGLHLQAAEAKELETFAKMADFLLDNQDAQEEKLNNLIIGTLVYVMGKGFSSKIATDCLGCKEGNANQTMHD